MSERLEQDGVDLVYWFECRADNGTRLSDERIAASLNWFVGGFSYPQSHSARQRRRGGGGPDGDAARVRRARRYVDRNNGPGQTFHGYSFGTKRNGSGVKFMMLHTPRSASATDAVVESFTEQFGRSVQLDQQTSAELARHVDKFQTDEADFIRRGEFEKALVCHDVVNDLLTFRRIRPETRSRAVEVGLLTEVIV